MTFRVQYAPHESIKENLSPLRLVEDYGYKSNEDRIRDLMLAGESLRHSRASDFDVDLDQDGIADGLPAVIYKPDFTEMTALLDVRARRAAGRRALLEASTKKESHVDVLTPKDLAAQANAETAAPTGPKPAAV